MILYNTTFHVDSSIEPEFLAWLKGTFVAEALNAGFSDPMLARIAMAVEEGCSSFALHLYSENLNHVARWESTSRQKLLADAFNRWGERFLSFSTPMHTIEL